MKGKISFKLIIYTAALLFIVIESLEILFDTYLLSGVIRNVGNAVLLLSIINSFDIKRLMKKKMWFFMFVLLVIIWIIGALFRLQHWPGAGILLTISMFLFPIYYMAWKFLSVKQYDFIALLKVGFVSLYFYGKLFSIMHWPGSNVFEILSLLIWIIFLSIQIGYMFHPKVNEAIDEKDYQ